MNILASSKKTELAKQYKKSGLSKTEFCKREKITIHQLNSGITDYNKIKPNESLVPVDNPFVPINVSNHHQVMTNSNFLTTINIITRFGDSISITTNSCVESCLRQILSKGDD